MEASVNRYKGKRWRELVGKCQQIGMVREEGRSAKFLLATGNIRGYIVPV